MAHSHLLDYFRCSNLVIVYNTRTYVGMYRDGNTSTTIDTAVVYSPYRILKLVLGSIIFHLPRFAAVSCVGFLARFRARALQLLLL
jgi:hypothetical protein